MSEVLILSDSHGLTKEITEIVNRHQINHVIHCGDSELEVDDPALDGVLSVKGNCDFDSNLPKYRVLDIDGVSFFVAHGHLQDVNMGLLNLAYAADQHHAQVVCFGHTHFAVAEKVNDQLFINPGSIRLPRRRQEKTYAIMKWDQLDKVHVDFYETNGKHFPEISYITSLR